MADDDNDDETKDTGEEDTGEEEEEDSAFSKVGGMFGGGDEKEDDSSTDKMKQKVNPASLFDLNALKEFGLSVLTLFIETLIISIVCVNILFYCTPESIRNNSLNL